jgi:hypothetical protein
MNKVKYRNLSQLFQMIGKEVTMITTSTALSIVIISAGIAAIFKILFSSTGRLTIPGLNATWGN